MTHPDLARLLPHSGPMRWLDEVLHHEPARTVCRVDPRRSALLADAEGRLPSWLALEFMAQCAAAHGALLAEGSGVEAPAPALLLGARRLRLFAPHLDPARPLEVEARHRAGQRGLVAFDCELRDPERGQTLAAGRLNVYTLTRADAEGRRSDGS